MKNLFNYIRPILSVLLLVYLFLNWITLEVTADAFGVSSGMSDSYSGFGLLGVTYVSLLLPLIPIILLCVSFLPMLDKYKKALYPVGSIVGIIATIISMTVVSAVLGSSSGSGDISTESKGVWGIGIWLTIITYIAIIVLSLIIDFKISPQSIKEKGLKGTFTNVVGEVTSSTTALAASVKNGSLQNEFATMAQGTPCPQCGNNISFGKKFCTKCGYKLEVASSTPQANTNVPANSIESNNVANPTTASVSESTSSSGSGIGDKFSQLKNAASNKIPTPKMRPAATYSGVACEKCFCVSDISKKYCPDCGTQLHPIRKCASCGHELLEGKTFCAECGTSTDYKKLCKECGTEIIPGKAFCTECGSPVSYEQTCSSCGAPVIKDKRFCPDCGTPYSNS